MFKRIVIIFLTELLVLPLVLAVSATNYANTKPKPVTDLTQLVRFNLDEINIASPKTLISERLNFLNVYYLGSRRVRTEVWNRN